MKIAPLASLKTPVLPNFIAANLRVLRKQQGWSQSELAERVHLNRGNIASYESGSAEPNICKTLRISQLFGISARDLIRRDLSDPEELTLARVAHSQDQRDKSERLAEYRAEALQLRDLLDSSRRLFDFKRENHREPCAEADMMAAHYEQLYQVTQRLLDSHQGLLADVGCQCD